MTPGSAPDPGHESNDARGAKRVRGLAPPPYRGGSELDVIFEPHRQVVDAESHRKGIRGEAPLEQARVPRPAKLQLLAPGMRPHRSVGTA